ncbi:scavenger receptor cysteine-rich type 1 protein M130-like [Poeciliopsis prolifica]|uniref:scavenger receptor cysteine-rich type 1 protein M130-like n=1 Tax=Poeciliopsis prolifica TaxID=188132 RepID=UPI0024132D22|nr:scavenger receptor cysteine-rich type 1 protein M130-like [Poeciliopsis prolifica]
MRADSKKVAILITDGQSQDQVEPAAKNLKDTGIETYVIGVGQDVEHSEMKIIASGDVGTHVYISEDFRFLHSIINSLTHSLCHRAPSTDSVRLVNGTSLCSGRLEVKTSQSNQNWSLVCKDDFDWEDADVVCKELGCGSPSALKGALYGEVEASTWTAKFNCGGTESSLLDCRRSGSDRNTCQSKKALRLTCSEPIRLAGGASRCEGTLELKRTEWRPVKGPDWFLMEAAVVCGQMNCGSAVSVQKREKSSVGSVWWVGSDCVRSGYPLRECASADLSSSVLDITCLDSVRLVNGTSLCSGRLEVKTSQSNQNWSLVCKDDFEWEDGDVVCKDLGCGPPSALKRALYGEVEAPTWTAKFNCEGTESSLLDCRRSGSDRNTCHSKKAVRLTCSEPIRLAGGASRCEGALEVKLGSWKPVTASGWTKKAAAAACRDLDCGSLISQGARNDSSVGGVWEMEISCLKSGRPLRQCASQSVSSSQSGTILELVCSDLLAHPTISVSSREGLTSNPESTSVGVFLGFSFTISCSVQPQYPGGSFRLSFTSSNTTHSYAQPASNHSAHFLFPAAEPAHGGSYSCVYNVHVFSHNFSSDSRVLILRVTDPTVFLIRLVVLLLSLLISISVIYWSHQVAERPPGGSRLTHGRSGCWRKMRGEVAEDQEEEAL